MRYVKTRPFVIPWVMHILRQLLLAYSPKPPLNTFTLDTLAYMLAHIDVRGIRMEIPLALILCS